MNYSMLTALTTTDLYCIKEKKYARSTNPNTHKQTHSNTPNLNKSHLHQVQRKTWPPASHLAASRDDCTQLAKPPTRARHHSSPSSRINFRICWTLGESPLKNEIIAVFVQHPSVQAPKTTRELRPSFMLPRMKSLILKQQSLSTTYPAWGEGESPTRRRRSQSHTCLENTQPIKICWMVSSFLSHKGQWLRGGRPFLASQSAVQHLLCAASHKKNWHFFGAQVLHISSQGSKTGRQQNQRKMPCKLTLQNIGQTQ
jgi:hypothetical protein